MPKDKMNFESFEMKETSSNMNSIYLITAGIPKTFHVTLILCLANCLGNIL